MTHATRSARNASALIAREGEAVTLPTGAARGVVMLPQGSSESRPRGSDIGARLSIGRQQYPELYLRSADADWLAEGETVTVRGVEYLVVSLTPDGYGLTRVEMMRPGAEPGLHPEWRQWR